jgi:hypothetical protein
MRGEDTGKHALHATQHPTIPPRTLSGKGKSTCVHFTANTIPQAPLPSTACTEKCLASLQKVVRCRSSSSWAAASIPSRPPSSLCMTVCTIITECDIAWHTWGARLDRGKGSSWMTGGGVAKPPPPPQSFASPPLPSTLGPLRPIHPAAPHSNAHNSVRGYVPAAWERGCTRKVGRAPTIQPNARCVSDRVPPPPRLACKSPHRAIAASCLNSSTWAARCAGLQDPRPPPASPPVCSGNRQRAQNRTYAHPLLPPASKSPAHRTATRPSQPPV